MRNEAQRRSKRLAAEADVGDHVSPSISTQEHVTAPGIASSGVPQHARRESCNAKAERLSAWLKSKFCSKQ
jgi:hypothetical protein